MNAHVKAFAFFLAFAVVTKAVVVPMAKQMSIPYLSDL